VSAPILPCAPKYSALRWRAITFFSYWCRSILKFSQRNIDYVMIHRCLHERAPSYLPDGAVLRSAESRTVAVWRTLSSLGDRAFAVAAPRAWNSLPLSIRSIDSADCFRKNFKTHLFNVAFNPWFFAYFDFAVVLAFRRSCCVFTLLNLRLLIDWLIDSGIIQRLYKLNFYVRFVDILRVKNRCRWLLLFIFWQVSLNLYVCNVVFSQWEATWSTWRVRRYRHC